MNRKPGPSSLFCMGKKKKTGEMGTKAVQPRPLQASRWLDGRKNVKIRLVKMVVKCRTLSRSRVVTVVHSCREKCRRGRTSSLKTERRNIHVLMPLRAHHPAPLNGKGAGCHQWGIIRGRSLSPSLSRFLSSVPRRCEALSKILWQKKTIRCRMLDRATCSPLIGLKSFQGGGGV